MFGSVTPVPFVLVALNGDKQEAYADAAVRKIIDIADTAPPELKEQARAFQGQIKEVVLMYIRQAVEDERKKLGLGEK